MKVRYSPSTKTSYPHEIDYGKNLPGDLIEVEQADFDMMLAARASGKNANFKGGKLIVEDQATPSFEILSRPLFAEFNSVRDIVLNRLSGIGFAAKEEGDEGTVSEVLDARQALLDLPAASAVLVAMDLEDSAGLRVAMRSEYQKIRLAMSSQIQKAFLQDFLTT